MKIVVGFIDTPEGHAAVDAAVTEARLRGGDLVVVNSMRGGTREDGATYVATADAFDKLTASLDDSDVAYETHEFVRGNSPAQDIIDAVESTAAGMIVIGIRERSATGKLLLGSNALDILHDSPVPVLCVKASTAS
jgi:nucleotide-binding universal stress UspA family protein